jgi:Sigma-70, region 4
LTTLKEFEEALREQGMQMALAVLERLREKDRAKRSMSPARRVSGRKMTPELAHQILELHANTGMTQQEIAFELGVNQGRVNEVIKRGKWLTEDPSSPEAQARDKALERMKKGIGIRPQTETRVVSRAGPRKGKRAEAASTKRGKSNSAQLAFGDL